MKTASKKLIAGYVTRISKTNLKFFFLTGVSKVVIGFLRIQRKNFGMVFFLVDEPH